MQVFNGNPGFMTILFAMMTNTNVSLIISIPIPKIGREINFSNRKNDGQRLPLAPRHRPRQVRICNPDLSKRGFVITFIPVPVEVFVFNITSEGVAKEVGNPVPSRLSATGMGNKLNDILSIIFEIRNYSFFISYS